MYSYFAAVGDGYVCIAVTDQEVRYQHTKRDEEYYDATFEGMDRNKSKKVENGVGRTFGAFCDVYVCVAHFAFSLNRFNYHMLFKNAKWF